MKINSVAITIKKDSQKALALREDISSWLQGRGTAVRRSSGTPDDLRPEPGKPSPDLIIILGGDGTILSRALSVNPGQLKPLKKTLRWL